MQWIWPPRLGIRFSFFGFMQKTFFGFPLKLAYRARVWNPTTLPHAFGTLSLACTFCDIPSLDLILSQKLRVTLLTSTSKSNCDWAESKLFFYTLESYHTYKLCDMVGKKRTWRTREWIRKNSMQHISCLRRSATWRRMLCPHLV